MPGDVLQILTGAGAPIGKAIVDSVDYVMFTGSTEVGRSIAEMAGRGLIGCSMELGGKNAAIVLPDADMKRTVQGWRRRALPTRVKPASPWSGFTSTSRSAGSSPGRFAEHSAALPVTPASTSRARSAP